jgi:hypothetical protein
MAGVSTIAVPRWLLASVVGALALSLLVVAYMVGMEAGRRVATAPSVQPHVQPSRAPRATPPVAVATPEVIEPPAAPADVPEEPPLRPASQPAPRPVGRAAAPAAPPATGVAASPESRSVADYFARVERIHVGDGGLSPDAAQGMLASMLQGDTSGFDKVVADARQGERELAEVVPPPACAGYHAALGSVLHDSLAMLGELRSAITSGDTNAVLAASGRASELQRRAEALKEQERELRERFGLPPPA